MTPTQFSMNFERGAQVSTKTPEQFGDFSDGEAYMAMLVKRGWRRIEIDSSFAAVFTKDGFDYVVKVSALEVGRPTVKDGWFSFARWAMGKVGQDVAVHLPTIFYLGVFNYKTRHEFFVSHIERLGDKSDRNRYEHEDIVRVRGVNSHIAKEHKNSLIHKLMVELRAQFIKTWQFDLHTGNTMGRASDGKLVVIDPLSFRASAPPKGPTGRETAGLMA